MRKAGWLGWFGLAALCTAMLTAGTAVAQGGKDTVIFKNNQQWISVDVKKETYKGVTVAGKDAPAKPWEIESIKHGDRPLDYLAGEQALKQGQYERGVEKFQKALAAKGVRPWINHYAGFYIAQCKQKMAEGGQPAALAAAAAEYEKVIKATPDGIFVPDAKFGIAQCYYQANQLDKAEAVLKEMVGSDYGEFWQLKAKLWLGRILLDQGKGAEAAKIFDEVQKAAPKDSMPEIYYEAGLSRAQGLILAKQFDEARKLLEKIFGESELDDIKAAAHNGMGDAFRAEKRIQEARLEYLRVIVLYLDAPEQRARALFFAADCFQQLKDIENARRFQGMLKQQYPESVWSRRLGG